MSISQNPIRPKCQETKQRKQVKQSQETRSVLLLEAFAIIRTEHVRECRSFGFRAGNDYKSHQGLQSLIRIVYHDFNTCRYYVDVSIFYLVKY